MTLNIDREHVPESEIDWEAVAKQVVERVLETEGCPYETEVNLLLTDDDEIHRINREYRDVDRPTDVLSFPQVEYETPADFGWAEAHERDCFHPDTGELMLGDIIVSMDRVREQAEKYGHGQKREYAFLIAHSMLHLLGYDHMTEPEAADMEARQSAVLESLGITR